MINGKLVFITMFFTTSVFAATFVQEPSLIESDGRAVISFSISDPADVEVAVLDYSGKVVRHLAAGVLGSDTLPPEPLTAGLSQSLSWDGLDDYGNILFSGPFRVRVRIGVTPQFEKRIHLKDTDYINPASFDIWSPTGHNYGWGPDTVVDTAEIISPTDPVLLTGSRNTGTGVGLYDGGTTMIDMCVSKETDDIILQAPTWLGGSPLLLWVNGITGLKQKLWTGSTEGFPFGEPDMDWFGRFFLHDRGYEPCSPDLYRFSLDGTPLDYSWGTNKIDMPTYSNDGIRQQGFCNDQNGNIYQAHYPFAAEGEPLIVTKWDSVGILLKDSLIAANTTVQGVRVDLKGNIFIGVKLKPLTDTVPKEIRPLLSGAWNERAPFSQAAVADEVYGSIVKFGPQGGSIVYDPAGPYYKLSLLFGNPYNGPNRLSVNGAKWVHFGSSFIMTKIPDANDMTVCGCYNPRFDVDRFGRVIYPDPFNNDFHALDNNGNAIFRVHNRDLFPEVSVGSIVNIQATDRALYLGDHINNQIIVMTWRADAEQMLDIPTVMAERLRPNYGPLEVGNYPNPFGRSTTLRIRGAGPLAAASLVIYNLAGQKVLDLTRSIRSGNAQIKWDGTNGFGEKTPNGFYCCRLTMGNKTVSRIMLLAR